MDDRVADASAVPTRIPQFERLLWPTLIALKALGGSGSNQEIDSKVAELERVNDAQLSVLHLGGPQSEISYRLAWARTYLRKVNAIENSDRGVWALTSTGGAMTQAEVAKVPAQVRRQNAQGRRKRPEDGLDKTVEGLADDGADETEDAWRDRLLEAIAAIRPDAFERLCQRLLREAGFSRVEVTGRSGDGGIDGVGVLRLSLVGFQVLFQSKRVKGSLGSPVIRDFRGAMTGRADKGIVITTGSFTPDAKREATRDGAPPIELIDGTQLCDLMRQFGLGVHPVEVVRIDRDWFDALGMQG